MANLPQDTYQPENTNNSAKQAILILTANDTEDLEFFYPYYRFIEAGYKVDVVTPAGGEFSAKHKLGLKQTKKITEVDAEDYALLYIPGGKAPAELKKNDNAIALTRRFVELGKPIAAICHGPQVLAAADVIQGKSIAAFPEVESEIQDAGARYINKETVTDGLFTTARWPGDLPAHLKAVLAVLMKSAKFRETAAA